MIELKNICSGYGKNKIIDGISFCIEKGKITTIIGSNGCGKSTLLKTVSGILSPFSGEITLDKEALLSMSKNSLAKRIAYLSQVRSLPDMTAYSLVLHGRFPHTGYPRRYSDKDKEIALSAMEQAGVLQYAYQPLSSLSGGTVQNVYIAMALCRKTDYILLDEPCTYLDITSSVKLMKTLKKLCQDGKGIVTVMHDLPCAFTFSDKICVMKNGRLLMCDSPEKVYSSRVLNEAFGEVLHLCRTNDGYFYNYKNIQGD